LIWTKWPSIGYILVMSTHSVAEAKNQLSRLIDRALDGEPVVITRHGHPVVELRPVTKKRRRPLTREERQVWLESNPPVKLRGIGIDPVELVSKIRDEDWP
jgi:prevent-host-death family protein